MTTQDVRTGPRPDPELPETEAPAPLRAVHTLINDDDKLLENSFMVPDAALADVPAALQGPAGNGSEPRGVLGKA